MKNFKKIRRLLLAAGLSALLMFQPAASGAETKTSAAADILPAEDPMDALVTQRGMIEIRSDARIFVLYAALNAAGYDEAPLLQNGPFPRRSYPALRRKVRHHSSMSPELSENFQKLFSGSSETLRDYASCALAMNRDFSVPEDRKAACDGRLSVLPIFLRSFWLENPLLSETYAEVAGASREILKPMLPSLDRIESALAEFFGFPTPELRETDLSPDAFAAILEILSSERASEISAGNKFSAVVSGNLGASELKPAEETENADRNMEACLLEISRVLAAKAAAKGCGLQDSPSPSDSASLRGKTAVAALALHAFHRADLTAQPDLEIPGELSAQSVRKTLKAIENMKIPGEFCEFFREAPSGKNKKH